MIINLKRRSCLLSVALLIAFIMCTMAGCSLFDNKHKNDSNNTTNENKEKTIEEAEEKKEAEEEEEAEEAVDCFTLLSNAYAATLGQEEFRFSGRIQTGAITYNPHSFSYERKNGISRMKTGDSYRTRTSYYYTKNGRSFLYVQSSEENKFTGYSNTVSLESKEILATESEQCPKDMLAPYFPDIEHLTDEEKATFNSQYDSFVGIIYITYVATINGNKTEGTISIYKSLGIISGISARTVGEEKEAIILFESRMDSFELPSDIPEPTPLKDTDDEQDPSSEKAIFGDRTPTVYTKQAFMQTIFGDVLSADIDALVSTGVAFEISQLLGDNNARTIISNIRAEAYDSVYHFTSKLNGDMSDRYIFENEGKYYQRIVIYDNVIQIEIEEADYLEAVGSFNMLPGILEFEGENSEIIEIKAVTETFGMPTTTYRMVFRVKEHGNKSNPEEVTGTKDVVNWGTISLRYLGGNIVMMTMDQQNGEMARALSIELTNEFISARVPEATIVIDSYFGENDVETVSSEDFNKLVFGEITEKQIEELIDGNISMALKQGNVDGYYSAVYMSRYDDSFFVKYDNADQNGRSVVEAYYWVDDGRYYCGAYYGGRFTQVEIAKETYDPIVAELNSNVIMMLFAEDDDSAQSVEIVRLNEIEKEDGSITRSVLFRTDSMAGILVSDFSSDGMIDGLDAYLWGADSAMALIFDFNIDPFVIPQ